MKLAYSTLACPDWTVEQCAEAANRYQYDAIEWRLADGEIISPQTAPEVKRRVVEATRRNGLKVACLDTSCKFVQPTPSERARVVRETQAMVELAGELEAPFLRVFGGAILENMTRDELIPPTAEALAEAAAYAASHGVTILLETHDDWARSQDVVALLCEARAPKGLAVLWDVHHPYRMGEKPRETYATLTKATRIAHVHVKDARRQPANPNEWQLTLLEEGEVPVKEALQVLNEAGYSGYVSVEWEKKWHPEIDPPEIALPQFANLLRWYLAEMEAA
ncbi:MAG TPA: sugar phosphate isomerase/epimerase [Chloroflexia bacterium]|nr:sugar phosphate isomerase/epimerase [Chloroflexia bacterium]